MQSSPKSSNTKLTQKEICEYLDLEPATFSRWRKTRPKLHRALINYFALISAARFVDYDGIRAIDDVLQDMKTYRKDNEK